jgi:hypothetical protein
MGENGAWVLIIIIVLLVLWTFSRRRKPRSSKLDTAIAVLSDINYNLKILEIRTADKTSKKNFKVMNWRFYRDRVEFLQPEVVTTINESFTIAEEFKNKIDIAKKNNTLESLDIQLERLKEPLTQGKKGLVAWLKDNVNAEMQSNTRRNWLGF